MSRRTFNFIPGRLLFVVFAWSSHFLENLYRWTRLCPLQMDFNNHIKCKFSLSLHETLIPK